MRYKCHKCENTFQRHEVHIFHRYHTKKHGERIKYSCRPCDADKLRRYRHTPKGKKQNLEKVRRHRKRHPKKEKARRKLRYAVESGKIKVPPTCSVVGCKSDDLQAHHFDYSLPYNVLWLCRNHHNQLHHGIIE